MNSKQKGSRGERALRDVWKAHGYEDAHRSQQYSGKGESSADIEGIDPRLHIECKVGYTYKTIYDFLEQAKRDAKEGQIPVCNIKMDRMPWLWVCYLDDGIEMWKNQLEMIPIIPMELKKELHIDDIEDFKPRIIGNVEVVTRCPDCIHSKSFKELEGLDEDLWWCPFWDKWFIKDFYCAEGRREDE